jgi:hypothetical protein
VPAVVRVDLILLDAAVGLVDAHHQGKAERERGHADHDGGEDEHVREGVGVELETLLDDRRGAAEDLAGRDVEEVDGGLEDAQADQLLHQVAAGDHDVHAGHQQDHRNPVVDVLDEAHRSLCRPRSRPANR